ncbi:hypothetical protein HQ587_00885 [bacterium]|nr:hypothetical protein [bacterium]
MRNLQTRRICLTGLISIALVTLLFWSPHVNPPGATFAVDWNDEQYLTLLNECTTGVASGAATPDGKPLLWKNRDISRADQEFQYVDDGRIPFISITYRDENDEYYGGINAAGFALENSNSYNLEGGPYRNGWGSGDDDGEIHMLALSTCRTVDDFEAILDSTDVDGRTLNSNYGAFDAFGGVAMFETGGYSYTRIDAIDTPDGFIVRSNYSYSGRNLNNRMNYWGPHRHDRGYHLWKKAKDENNLTPRYIFQQVVRDLTIDGVDPYPLPFDGYVEGSSYGCIPNGEAICRSTSKGILVAQGVRSGERPDDGILWAMVGNQLATIATPLWVRAGSVPVEYDSDAGSRICTRGQQIAEWVYDENRDVDTWKLMNPQGTGIWDYTLDLENMVFDRVHDFINSHSYDLDRLEAFQNIIARQIADSLIAWHPVYEVTERLEAVFEDNNIHLIWGENLNMEQMVDEDPPRGYNVFRSHEPFREGERGELLGFTEEATFTDRNLPDGAAFYRVEIVF